ncbi:MAG TPA: SMP-30/gluconolactonase/LRE family protein, partial [Alphaproteobacteria bacterium]|nr:SMP-30/gluconolactonase/LRE family protein [Alphaproteobacteria bacterium]
MPFRAPAIVPARVFTRMPDEFRRARRNAWTDANRGGRAVDSFLEGPSVDRDGNLWVVDVPFGRVFRIAPSGTWTLVAEYDGWPNGLKIHRDGRVFLADYKNGLMTLDPSSG